MTTTRVRLNASTRQTIAKLKQMGYVPVKASRHDTWYNPHTKHTVTLSRGGGTLSNTLYGQHTGLLYKCMDCGKEGRNGRCGFCGSRQAHRQ